MEIINFKKFALKIANVIISMTIKLEYFGLNNILINEKWNENILLYDISYNNFNCFETFAN